MFCEPASAASVAGLLAYGAEGRVVCVLTGHGLKDPQTAMNRAASVIPCEPDIASVEAAGAGGSVNRHRIVNVPASSANLGPGFDVLAAALSIELELEVEETGVFSVTSDTPGVPLDRTNLCVRAFEKLHPADGLSFAIRSEIPPSGGLGSSAACIVAGLAAADHMYELDAPLYQLRARDGGPPRQHRRRAVRGLRDLRSRRPGADRAGRGPGGHRGHAARRRCRPSRRAPRCPPRCP